MPWLIWHQNEFLRVRTPELDDGFDPYLAFTSRSLGEDFCKQGQLAGVQCELMPLKMWVGLEYGGFLIFHSQKLIDLYALAPNAFPVVKYTIPRRLVFILFLPVICLRIFLFLRNLIKWIYALFLLLKN